MSLRKSFAIFGIVALIVSSIGVVFIPVAQAAPNSLTRVTALDRSGIPNLSSTALSMSDDGRYIAFKSEASNLVTGDTNNAPDIFLYDNNDESIIRVSVSSNGTQANNGSDAPFISGNGQFVAYMSYANNLVANDLNGVGDIFVYNVSTGETVRASVDSNGVAANLDSGDPSLSTDGRYVAFYSYADNLVEDDENNNADVFVHDLQTGSTVRASVDEDGVEISVGGDSPSISGNGQYVVFTSSYGGLYEDDDNTAPDVFRKNLNTGAVEIVSVNDLGVVGDDASFTTAATAISADGRYVVFITSATNLFENDDNDIDDVHVRDMVNGQTLYVSMTYDAQRNYDGYVTTARISSNGNVVTYFTTSDEILPNDNNLASDLVSVNIQSEAINRITVNTAGDEANAQSTHSAVSGDGSIIAFSSIATNLSNEDLSNTYDIFIRNVGTTRTTLLKGDGSVPYIVGGNGDSTTPEITSDGRYVVFASAANNLVPGDVNNQSDIFLYDRVDETYEIISLAYDGSPADWGSFDPSISADGRYVVFSSEATNLVVGDDAGYGDIFLKDRQSDTTTLISYNYAGDFAGNGSSHFPRISADGRYVVFASYAANLLDGEVDANSALDIFRFDTSNNTIIRVNVSSDEEESDGGAYSGDISADGRYIAFSSDATNLTLDDNNANTDVFLRDVVSGTTTLITKNYLTGDPVSGGLVLGSVKISENGNAIIFATSSDELVPNDTNDDTFGIDVFLYNRISEEIIRVTVNSDGEEQDMYALPEDVNVDGSIVLFSSVSTNLVDGYGNGTEVLLYRHIVNSGVTDVVSVNPDGTQPNGSPFTTMYGSMSGDGSEIVFASSDATLIDPSESLTNRDIFLATMEGDGGGDPTAPIFTTEPATNITQTSANLHGTLVDNGGDAVIFRGIGYDVNPEDASSNAFILTTGDPDDIGPFSGEVTGLECGTTYYFIAGGLNQIGIGMGDARSFNTLDCDPVDNGSSSGGGQSGSIVRNNTISRTDIHPNGTLIINNGTVFLLKDSQRVGFRDSEEYRSHGYNFAQVVDATSGDMSRPLHSLIAKAMVGSLVLDSSDGRTVYMIGENNTKRGFTSSEVFRGLGYTFRNLFTINLSDYNLGSNIENMSEAHPEGSLVRSSDGTVWWLKNGKRLGFESEQVFRTYGFTFDRLVPANSADMALEVGDLVKFRDGTLVRFQDKLYIVSDSKKYEFSSEQIFAQLGYKLSNVIAASLTNY